MKTFKLTVDENELRAIISHHMYSSPDGFTVERSSRIHDLTKRLNKETPELEKEETENNPKVENNTAVAGW